MEVGVFIPIGNNGWLISETAPQYMPSFELNKKVTQAADRYGLDFALSMIKLRGFGGKTEFWDYNLESFTLMAGLAAVTSKIKLFGTAATLIMPPAIIARMATTIDSISNGRFGVNLITGWQRPEYSQMGLWPGDDYFSDRYEFLTEYTTVLKDLLTTGQSDLKGKHFQMDDCRMKPIPEGDVKLICAGSSNAGMDFSATFADYSFCFGVGVNTPKAFAPTNERLLFCGRYLMHLRPRAATWPADLRADDTLTDLVQRHPDQAPALLLRALRALGQQPGAELLHASPRELLDWGIAHWDASRIPRTLTLAEAQLS